MLEDCLLLRLPQESAGVPSSWSIMSLGFLTESALLPSKSKPIQVDSRSQIRKWFATILSGEPQGCLHLCVMSVAALKAIVAEELSKKEAKESKSCP